MCVDIRYISIFLHVIIGIISLNEIVTKNENRFCDFFFDVFSLQGNTS